MAQQDSTSRITLQQVLAVGGWTQKGADYVRPCPICGSGDDGFVVGEGDNGDPRRYCRPCGGRLDGPAWRAHLEAIGVTVNGAQGGPTGIGKRAIEPPAPPPYEPTGREGLTRDWTCTGPDGTARHSRRPVVNQDGTTSKVVTWPDGGAKTKRLLYAPGGPLPPDGRPVVITEGEVDADAAHGRGLLALATVCGEATAPDVDVLAWAGLAGRVAILWPDFGEGAGHMRKVAANLAKLTPPATVHVVDPARLALKWTKGAGCADWLLSTDADPLDALRGALAAPVSAPAPSAPTGKPKGPNVTTDDMVAWFMGVLGAQGLPEDVCENAADAGTAALRDAGGALAVRDALYALRWCEGWTEGLRPADKCALRTLLVDGAGVYPGVAMSTIGQYSPRSGWQEPVDAPADDGDEAPWVSLDTLTGEAGADWRTHASGLIYPGRSVLLSGKAKQGKSTTVAAAVAGILTGADWLTGEVQAPGDVLWIGAVGESQAAEVRDLVTDAHAPVDALARLHFMRARPSQGIKAALAKFPIDNLRAVIVDSARGLMSAEGGDEDSSDDVRRTMAVVAELAEGEVGALSIHHMRRDKDASVGDRTRGSGDWLAVVDVVVEFDRTDAGAKLTYDGRRGGPSTPLELTRGGGSFQKGGGGTTGGDTGGGGDRDVFQIQDPLAPVVEYAEGWLMRNPEGAKRAFRAAARDAGHRTRTANLDAALERARTATPPPPGTRGTPPPCPPCPVVPHSGARSGHGAGHGVPHVPQPIAGTVPGTVPGARLPGTGQAPSEAPTFDPGGAFTATPAEETPTMPRDIPTVDPADLTDTEHAELVSAWDAAVTKAQQGGAKWTPVNPAAIIATNQFRRPPRAAASADPFNRAADGAQFGVR